MVDGGLRHVLHDKCDGVDSMVTFQGTCQKCGRSDIPLLNKDRKSEDMIIWSGICPQCGVSVQITERKVDWRGE